VVRQPDGVRVRIEGRHQGGIEVDRAVRKLGDFHFRNDPEDVQPGAQRRAGTERNLVAVDGVGGIGSQLNVIAVDTDHNVVGVINQSTDRVAAAGLIIDFVPRAQPVAGQFDRVVHRVDDGQRARGIERGHHRVPLEALHCSAAGRCEVDERAGRGFAERVGQAEHVLIQPDHKVLRAVRQRCDRVSLALAVRDLLARLHFVRRRDDQIVDRVDFVRGEPMVGARGAPGQVNGDSRQGVRPRAGKLESGFADGNDEVILVVVEPADRVSAAGFVPYTLPGDVVVKGRNQHRFADLVDHRLGHRTVRIEGQRPGFGRLQFVRAAAERGPGFKIDRRSVPCFGQLDITVVDLDHEVGRSVGQTSDRIAAMSMVGNLLGGPEEVVHEGDGVRREIDHQLVQVHRAGRVEGAGPVRRIEDGVAADHLFLGQRRVRGVDQGVAGRVAVAR